MTAKTNKVTDPSISVFTKHLMPITEEKWEKRKPTDLQKRKIATTVKSLKDAKRKVEFKFGYTSYYLTLENANESWVSNWCNPSNEEQALNGKDVEQAISLAARDGYEMGAGHKTNLIIGNSEIANRLLDIYNTQKKDIRFIAITDRNKTASSSRTKDGYRPSNIYTVDFMTEKNIESASVGKTRNLNEFIE